MNSFQGKRDLFLAWVAAHAEGRVAPVQVTGDGCLSFDPETRQTLKAAEHGHGTTAVYMLMEGVASGLSPLYIGKSAEPLSRWTGGHLRRLREAAGGGRQGSYGTWIKVLSQASNPLNLFCANEEDFLFPPLPGFPTTAGAVEYQLIGLAQDAFPGRLLNVEGAAR